VRVALHSRSSGTPPKVDGYPESFPSMIEASYGGYTWDSSKPRRERSSWTPKSAKKTYKSPAEIRLPDKSEGKKLQFNTAGERKIDAAMGGEKRPIARILAGKNPSGAGFEMVGDDRVPLPRKEFGSVDEVRDYLDAKKGELAPEMKAKIPEAIKKLREKEADPETGIDWYPY
jgi:hypothetical protein